eukprot:9625846-Alexandrium_andersonii.AAC.1
MSASLVGSEMCIRDRPPGQAQETRKKRCCPCLATILASVEEQKKRHKPVSYTHLTLPTICSV